jgi:hypothetical protein
MKADVLAAVADRGEADAVEVADALGFTYEAAAMALLRAYRGGLLVPARQVCKPSGIPLRTKVCSASSTSPEPDGTLHAPDLPPTAAQENPTCGRRDSTPACTTALSVCTR